MQDKTIFVDVHDKMVAVGGEPYWLPDFDWPEHVHTLSWAPERNTLRGSISQVGDAYSFDDFSAFAPYLAAWQDAKVKADAEKEAQRQADIAAAKEKQEAAEKDAAELQALVDAHKADLERQRPVLEAHAQLAGTDFKIVKVMEAKLIAEGALDPELVAQREAARQKIRDSKE